MKNNYTINGEGKTSIEFICQYSDDNHNFEENFHRMKNDLFLYTDWGNLYFNDFDLNDLYIITDDTRQKAMDEILQYENNTEKEVKSWSNESIKDELLRYGDYDIEDGYFELSPDFEIIESRGYSQRDYVQIIIPEKALLKLWGSEKIDYENLKKEIHNYLWDSEIWGNLKLDDEEIIEFYYFLSDTYNLDCDDIKKEVLEFVKKHYTKKQHKDLKEFLDENFHEIKYN